MTGIALTLAAFALVAGLMAWSRWLTRRRLASLGHALIAGFAGACAVLLWLLADGLQGYQPMRQDRAIAEIRFDEADAGRMRAILVRLPGGRAQAFQTTGDRWRVTAHTLVWQDPVARLGPRPVVRLETLEFGRAREVIGGQDGAASYQLNIHEGFDVWSRARTDRPWSLVASAGQAVGPWQTLAKGMRYSVRADHGTLLLEPVADATTSLATAGP